MFETVLSTVTGARRDSATQLAASAAYYALFSLAPLLLFLTSLSGFVTGWLGVENAVPRLMDWIFVHVGADAATVVEQPVRAVLETRSSSLLSVGAVLALWGAKTGIGALMHALNIAYGVDETRGWVHRNLLQLALTIALGVAVILSSTLILAGTSWALRIARDLGVESEAQALSTWLRWPMIVLLLVFALNAFYRVGPNTRPRFLEPLPGACLTVVLWGGVTFGFRLYLEHLATWAGAYGALSGLLAFIFWLWAVCLMMIIGGELNAALQARAEAREASPPRAVPDA
jgi:membrane protein